jgi:SAM-dependent methyltransferase
MTANIHSHRPQFAADELLDARYFKALDRFDIRFAPTMWVYDNVRAGSEVLHLGCGPGALALLKRKGITLTGVDTSAEAARAAHFNGYDATFQSDLSALPFADESFDYVVSFDVLGRAPEDEQKLQVNEIKRVLRRGGVTLHAIECNELSQEADHTARFQRCFQHVAIETRYSLFLSVADIIDQAEGSAAMLERDFVDYVRGLSFKERRSFDLAMGYAFAKVSDSGVSLAEDSTHIFLKASEATLGSFYNEHRDRRALFADGVAGRIKSGRCLDRNTAAVFDDGWFEPEVLPPVARWMGKHGRIRFHADEVTAIDLDLTTRLPHLPAKPLALEIFLNGTKVCALSLYKYGWLQLSLEVPEALQAKSNGEFELELRASRTAPPGHSGDLPDDRELSVAVCNIEIRGQRSEVGGQKSEIRGQTAQLTSDF